MKLNYASIRKLLFMMKPESAHSLAMRALRFVYIIPPLRMILKKIYTIQDPKITRTVFGIHFSNPIGLAAGFDKDAKYVDPLACLGFGFIEIGTVTPRAQSGNPKPRLFRLLKDKALINRMGFNNDGALEAARRLRTRRERIVIGGNLGKNKDTPNERAVGDYEKCFNELYDVVDYFVLNVSSPNTPGLRDLQEAEPLKQLLVRLQTLNKSHSKLKPILLKIAPDMTWTQLDEIIELVQSTGISGIVATNTTVDRSGLVTPNEEVEKMGSGGLSGAPLKNRSTEIVRYIHNQTNGQLPIIASGGVFNAEDAKEKLEAGASLVQIYTGFIYEGPGIVKRICESL